MIPRNAAIDALKNRLRQARKMIDHYEQDTENARTWNLKRRNEQKAVRDEIISIAFELDIGPEVDAPDTYPRG